MLSYQEWALDITFEPETFAFVPITKTEIISGLAVIKDKCPGNLVAIVSQKGQSHVDKFTEENPNWYEEFKSLE